MKRVLVGLAAVAGMLAAEPAANKVSGEKVTFTKHIAPILYQRCAECHRAGQIAPMSLLTYNEARPWARSMREKVLERTMPPWLADPKHGIFENDRRLSQPEIDAIVAWADGGAPQGDAKDLPAMPKFAAGWTLGQPDLIVKLQEEVEVAADGVIPYKYYTVPSGFTEDKWIQAAEIHPGNRAVVHHVIVSVAEPGAPSAAEPPAGDAAGEGRGRRGGIKLAGFAPGEQPKLWPKGTAKLVKAGSNFIFQVHYTPNGKAAKDRSYVGLYFAKDPVERKVLTATAMNARFVIPAGDGNHEVRSSWTAPEDVRIVDLMPHMHLRGKDFVYTAVYPDGRSEVILNVPKYDFNWQMLYRFKEPLLLPKGSRLDCVAHFDNSPNNKWNPDASKEVRWGPQTWEEMMIGWFDYVVN